MKDLMKQQFSYKNPDTLRKFITPFGSILPRSKTGLSAKEQKKLSKEIKRARHLALLPFTQTL
jgi:small subunit ribosomal protein S18